MRGLSLTSKRRLAQTAFALMAVPAFVLSANQAASASVVQGNSASSSVARAAVKHSLDGGWCYILGAYGVFWRSPGSGAIATLVQGTQLWMPGGGQWVGNQYYQKAVWNGAAGWVNSDSIGCE